MLTYAEMQRDSVFEFFTIELIDLDIKKGTKALDGAHLSISLRGSALE